jgi:hypothetical protein
MRGGSGAAESPGSIAEPQQEGAMEMRGWLLAEHAELRAFLERAVLRLVPADRWRERPGGVGNSIAWLLWHLARTEDLVINTVLRARPQVLRDGDWPARLGVDDGRIGTGFDEGEVDALSRAVDLDGLDAYRQAVCRATDDWLATVPAEILDAAPDVPARLAAIPPIAAPRAVEGLIRFWSGRPGFFLVHFPLVNHGFLHLGEMLAIRGRLGIAGF